ncbi:hypothetical protein QQZ08_008214 [Neonectria magnoliae]|uniref:Xylanolytic transcriptional activator regulatory domain-containing protein n=1 Tax=Neonectria magnoliae TaxID=2732573 RepID=A0ABR1HWJ5_9HYPO
MVQKKACDACHKRKSLSERLERIEGVLAKTIAHHEHANTSSAASTVSTPPVFTPTPSVTLPVPPQAQVRLGDQLAAWESTQSPAISTPSTNSTTGVSFGHIHYAGYHVGQISSYNGMPVLSEEGRSWLSARTGEDVSFGRFHLNYQKRSLPPMLSPWHFYGSASELYELPDRSITEQVMNVFFSSAFRLAFPVVDRVLFEETTALAYKSWEGQPSLERITAKGCVLAFLSIMCLFHGKVDNFPVIDSDSCAVKAHYLLSDVFEDASIVSLQTVFMLHMHQTFSGRLQSAAMLHAIACRIVFMLGGHTYTPTKSYGSEATHKEREARQLRMLFWLCYLFDKDIALRTGQPPLMSDDYCDLTLPDNPVECYHYLDDLDESSNHSAQMYEELTPHLPGDPRLSHLKDKTCRLLYSAQAVKKSDAELLRDIRELDDELENWRLSIPPDFRPSLSISKNTAVAFPAMKLLRSMRHICLHVEYHHLMTTIHRASGRFYAMPADNPAKESEWNGGVESSIALSLEASRSTVIYLKAAVNGLSGEAFWVIVFYPISAIMTLFLNIIMFPLDPQAKLDIDLLSAAADLVRSMPVRKMSLYEMGYMKLVNDFVAELIRLANCAIAKATKERELGKQETAIAREGTG